MKISIISSFFLPVPPVAGGAMEKIWFRLGREFAKVGHEVTHVSRRWPGFPNRDVIDSVTMLRVRGFNHTRSLPINLTLDFCWGLRVARALPPGDIVACNTVSLPAFLSVLKPAAGRVAAVLGRMPKGHARFYGRVDRIVATSEAVREKVLAENPRLAPRTRVFPNPIDWSLQQQPRQRRDRLTIGYVGRLNPEKGLELLLGAAGLLAQRTDLPPWNLRFIGPQTVAEGGGGDAYIQHLKQLAHGAGVAVSFEPPVYDPVVLARVYANLDVFCYPSLAEMGEGLSVAPIEAMASGAVPVVSALACYRDLIRPCENGLTFDHRANDRAAQLAGHLARLLVDDTLRTRLAEQGRADARLFDYAAIAGDLLADFSELKDAT